MAATEITLTKIPLNGGTALPELKAVDAADGAAVDFTQDDRKIVLLVKNANASAAKNVTVKMGNGLQGVVDLVQAVPAGATMAFSIESGAFKHVSGPNRGKVLVAGESTDIQVGAIVLP